MIPVRPKLLARVLPVRVLCGMAIASMSVSPACAQSLDELAVDWKPFRENESHVMIARFELSQPRPIKGVAAKIDLTASVEIVVTASNGENPEETTGMSVSSFLEKNHCDLAINAGPFQPVLLTEGGNHNVSGLQISAGQVVSDSDIKRPVITFDKSNRPSIYNAQTPVNTQDVYHAVPGFHIVLKNGKPQGQNQPLHPRTAAGHSRDGKQLFLLVVDGRRSNVSEGVTTLEVGKILRALGAYEGINLDGGGSSAMVMMDGKQHPKVLNTPINGGVPGWQRSVGSHLGIRLIEKNN